MSYTNDDGKSSFTGLTHGYYELTEVKAPDGYIMTSSAPIFFMVDDGVITWIEWSAEESMWIPKTTDSIVSFEAARAAVEADPDHGIEAAAAVNAVFTIENIPGSELPSTGGSGTRLFTILGSILILGAGVLLWRRRRMV